MPLRLASLDDIPDLYELGLKFYQTLHYSFPVSEPYAKAFLATHLADHNRLALILTDPSNTSPIGFLLGSSQAHPFVPVTVGYEIAWWVNEESRGYRQSFELLDAFEYWAVEIKGCKLISLATEKDSRVGRIYQRRGYTLKEDTWSKCLS